MNIDEQKQNNLCSKDGVDTSIIFKESAKPILTKIDKLIANDIENDEIEFLELLESLEEHYLDSSIVERTEKIKKAFEYIIELDFYCNKDVIYDINSDLFEELVYCIKSEKKGGKGYFSNFNHFEAFLGVKQNSLHQILFDKTYNFQKVNKVTYKKLVKFLKLFSNVDELNESLIICSKEWLKYNPKNKLESSSLSIKLFNLLEKSSYFDNLESENIDIGIYQNQYRYIIKNITNITNIEKISKKTKNPLLLGMVA